MNVENIERLAAVLESGPMQVEGSEIKYDQVTWIRKCGTAACIAGHIAIILHGIEKARKMFWRDIEDDAAQWLGMDQHDAKELFDGAPLAWKDQLKLPTPATAAATLRHLAKTGQVDWLAGARVSGQIKE